MASFSVVGLLAEEDLRFGIRLFYATEEPMSMSQVYRLDNRQDDIPKAPGASASDGREP